MTATTTKYPILFSMILSLCAGLLPEHGFAEVVFAGDGYEVQYCDRSYAGRPAQCTLSGTGRRLVVKGIVVGDGHIWVGGEVAIGEDGRISAVDCGVPPDEATVLDCPGALISAGFINLHEHIQQSYMKAVHAPQHLFNHRSQWYKASESTLGFKLRTIPEDDSQRRVVSERAMLRHMLAGTTSLLGADVYTAFTRNLGMRDEAHGAASWTPSLYINSPVDFTPDPQGADGQCDANSVHEIQWQMRFNAPYAMHAGEGVDAVAHAELACILQSVQARKFPNVLIHSIAVEPEDIQSLADHHVSVVVSPRSNFTLFGMTAPIAAMKQAGVNLALGTDWSATGSLSLLDEMRCLADYNHHDMNNALNWADIHRMVTRNAADALGIGSQVGRLSAGQYADMVVMDSRGASGFGEILYQTTYRDIVAVFIAGRGARFPVEWTGKLPATLENCDPDPRHLCGRSSMVCGASSPHALQGLLASSLYQIDDTELCKPRSTEACRQIRDKISARP